MPLTSATERPAVPTRRPAEPPITVSMGEEYLVVRPRGPLDLDATVTLVGAVNAAADAGITVRVDLDGHGAEADAGARAVGEDGSRPDAPVERAVTAGTGCLRLASSSSWWTVDLHRARLCRTTDPVDPRFLSADVWTDVRTLWVSPSAVAAVTADDDIVSARRRVA